MKTRWISFLLILALLLPSALPAFAAETAESVIASADVEEIQMNGDVVLAMPAEELLARGFAYGDVVTLSFPGRTLDVPFCEGVSNVDEGMPVLFGWDGALTVAVRSGEFASVYGIAGKTASEDGAFRWDFAADSEKPVAVYISLKEAGGYYTEYVLRSLSRGGERGDYPALTDAQFADFRNIATTGMGRNRLYRSDAPVDPLAGWNRYADAALKTVCVSVVLDLSAEPEQAEPEERTERIGDAIDGISVPGAAPETDAQTDASREFQERLAEGLRRFAAQRGVYAVCGGEGPESAAFAAALLECFMGARYNEIVGDYMATYYHFYGITEDDPRYDTLLNGGALGALWDALGVKNPKNAGLSAAAAQYLRGLGLTGAELAALRANLAENRMFIDTAENAWYTGAVQWAVRQSVAEGIGGGLFGVGRECTRAEFYTLVWRAAGAPEAERASRISVPEDVWYAEALDWLAQFDLYPDSEARLNGVVTRLDAARVLMTVYSAWFGVEQDGRAGANTEYHFTDVEGDWYDVAAVGWAVAHGVTNGTSETTFSPERPCTREQIVTMLYRLSFLIPRNR